MVMNYFLQIKTQQDGDYINNGDYAVFKCYQVGDEIEKDTKEEFGEQEGDYERYGRYGRLSFLSNFAKYSSNDERS
ncbi:MAG: hypothetical protein EZS28_005833 [Streblomastix strix]|uniref:Uncharacterized protein n=1 Tax=Streblomastix strix TaxID=222440 RepID=A0A5J4WVX0_9EUKA|nr:MAG: hypothetical protein EZS28_005833 [Streblomastix strix]